MDNIADNPLSQITGASQTSKNLPLSQAQDSMAPSQEQNNISETLAYMTQALTATGEQFDKMELFIKNQIETKDHMINSLHDELQYYKDDKSEKFIEQLMRSVIKVRKDMLKLMSSEKWNTMDIDTLKEQYTYIFEDLTDLLQMQNIVPYSSKSGDPFDGRIHQAKTVPTNDPALDRTIRESLSEGFRRGDKVMIAERVIVYSYQGGTDS